MLRVYVARPITHCDTNEVVAYYKSTIDRLRKAGAIVIHPLIRAELLRNKKFVAYGQTIPEACDHALLQRDSWMACLCDILFANLEVGTGKVKVSIGTVGEIMIGHHERKHTVTVMSDDNVHRHCFILEASDIILPDYERAMCYIEQLLRDYKGGFCDREK